MADTRLKTTLGKWRDALGDKQGHLLNISLPFIVEKSVWRAKDADDTVFLAQLEDDFSRCNYLVVSVATTAFSGTLDYQAKRDKEDGVYTNVGWTELDNEASTNRRVTNDQISYTTNTGNYRYLIPIAATDLRIVMTRTAGSITVSVAGFGGTAVLPAVAIEGLAASDAAEFGNPVMIGGSVDETSPAAAGEGDVRRVRVTPDGNLRVELTKDNVSTPSSNTDATITLANDVIVLATLSFKRSGANVGVQERLPDTYKMIDAVAITAGTGATVWTPASGKKFRLMGWRLSSSAAAALEFHDNAIGTIVMQSPLLAAAGIDIHEAVNMGFISAAANNVLKLDTSASATVSGMVWGVEE